MENEVKRLNQRRITKEELNVIINDIDDSLVKFIKEGKYKEVLMAMGNLGRFSFNNQMYILTQYPTSKTLYGLKKWNSLGRHINKGEKAIKIFSPIIKKDKDENQKEVYKVNGFKINYVFDFSQTNGKELDVFSFDKEKVILNKDKILLGLKKCVKEKGFNFIFVKKDELGEDVYGLCNHKEHLIKIRDDLCDLQTISTSIHECGHALAHSEVRDDFLGLMKSEVRSIKEIEAESIALVVSSYLHLDTSNFNFSYILGWSNGDIKKFRKNLNLISSYSNLLIKSIENELNLNEEVLT